MLDAARKTLAFTNGRSRTDLDTDEQLTLAIVGLVEIIGEAAKKVTPESRTASGDPIARDRGHARSFDPRLFRCGS
jgi:uncharacterized protein with HEPN domain